VAHTENGTLRLLCRFSRQSMLQKLWNLHQKSYLIESYPKICFFSKFHFTKFRDRNFKISKLRFSILTPKSTSFLNLEPLGTDTRVPRKTTWKVEKFRKMTFIQIFLRIKFSMILLIFVIILIAYSSTSILSYQVHDSKYYAFENDWLTKWRHSLKKISFFIRNKEHH
jgi:hypothetical protein